MWLALNSSIKISAQTNNNDIMKANLTRIQYHVTQENGTEPSFDNEYWDNKEEGIYVDVVSGEPLFSSIDKYESGTGWPSFTKAIEGTYIPTFVDKKLFTSRTEIRSKQADSHLGHVFDDGPEDQGGKRFCVNSAALRFVAREELAAEGYGEYLGLFESDNIKYEKAFLAGGCFWGVEELFIKKNGVIDVRVGYSGGNIENPTDEIIRTGLTNHAETAEITFDPNYISYEDILKFFFRLHDPTTLNSQGNDKGTQYRSAIFFLNDEQEKTAKAVIKQANESGVYDSSIQTELSKAGEFYLAADYHQDYLQRNPSGYTCHYVRPEWTF